MRRVLMSLGVVLGLLVLAVAGVFVSAFAGNAPLVAETLPGLGEVVLDGYVSVAVLDVGEGRYALVDAGNTPSGAPILAALEAHGAGPDAVVAILLTHGHPDHVAACGVFPRATVYLLADEIPFATGTRPYLGPLPRILGARTAPCAALTPVTDGQSLVVGSRTVEVFAVPGHTAGSAGYLVGDTLFLGDAARTRADGSPAGAPWVFSDDVPEDVASLAALARRLQGRPLARVTNAHTGSVPGAAFLALAR